MEDKELTKEYLTDIDWDGIADAPEEKVSEARSAVNAAISDVINHLQVVEEDKAISEKINDIMTEITSTDTTSTYIVCGEKLEEVGRSINNETHTTLKSIIDQLQKIIARAELLPSKPVREEGDEDVEEKTLTSKDRKNLSKDSFVFPGERRYPIHDEAHARAALQRVAQNGTPEEKKKVKAAVRRKYPNIKISEEEEENSDSEEISESIDMSKAELIGQPVSSKLSEMGHVLSGNKGVEWEAVCIAPGLSKNRTIYSDAVLEKASGLFEGVQCFADHSNTPSRSVKDLVGWFDGTKYVPGVGITAKFHALESRPWFTEAITEAFERGRNDLIGFSINGEGTKRLGKYDGKLAYFVESINKIDSVDGVVSPSAGGRAVRLLASQDNKEQEDLELLEDLNLEELKAARPDLVEQLIESTKETESSADSESDKEDTNMELKEEEKDKETEEALTKIKEDAQDTRTLLESLKKDAALSRADAKLTADLSKADLPEVVKDKLREDYAGKLFEDEELSRAISRERDVLSKLADQRPESFGRISVGENEIDKKRKAIQGMLSGEDVDGIPRAKSIREAYAMWNNDRRAAWQIDPSDILRECASPDWAERDDGKLHEAILSSGSGGTAGLFGTILNEYMYRRMLAVYAMPYLDDWKKIVSQITPIPDFRSQRRAWQGGYGKFSRVYEAQAYTAATSPTTDEANYAVAKYGGTETMTLETIANDDLGAIQRIPVSLARGMKHTLYESVFDSVLGNVALAWTNDATYLYSSASPHTNTVVATEADAALNDANLTAAKLLMFNQTEPGSSKKIGITPKYLVVPPALLPTARRLLENEFSYWGGNSSVGYAAPGTASSFNANFPPYAAANDINVHRNSLEIISVPYLSNTDSWFLIADPASHPTVEVGFYQGRQEPEMFVQDMSNVGSFFTNDYITYKIRSIFGKLVLDFRSFVKSSTAITP